jgi:CRISPR-associated protein Csx17
LVSGIGVRPIADVLAEGLQRRIIEVAGRSDRDEGEQVGPRPAYQYRIVARLEHVLAYLHASISDERLADLIAGCLLLGFQTAIDLPQSPLESQAGPSESAAYSLIAPFFHGPALSIDGVEVQLRPAANWGSLLRASRVAETVEDALRRLVVARLEPFIWSSRAVASGVDGIRLASALCFPVSTHACSRMLARVAGCLDQIEASSPREDQ